MKKSIAIVLALLVLSGSLVMVAFADGFSYGDADKDGKINVKDATCVQRYVAMLIEFDEESFRLADVDSNGNVNVKDATMIQKFLAMIIDGFPASTKPNEALPTEEAAETTSNTVVTGESANATATEEATSVTTDPIEDETDYNMDTTEPSVDTTNPREDMTEPNEEVTDPTEKATVPVQTTEPIEPTKPSVDKDGYYDQIIRP